MNAGDWFADGDVARRCGMRGSWRPDLFYCQ